MALFPVLYVLESILQKTAYTPIPILPCLRLPSSNLSESASFLLYPLVCFIPLDSAFKQYHIIFVLQVLQILHLQQNFHYVEDNKISFFLNGKKELILELVPESLDGNYYFWYITEKGKKEIQVISNHNKIEDWIIDTVVRNEHTVHIKVEEYKDISDGLKPYARGNRRTLTQLLHLRHLIKKLYALEDTNDEYMNMWQNEKDEDKRLMLFKQSNKKFMKDRKRLYHEIAEFMAEEGRSWWD